MLSAIALLLSMLLVLAPLSRKYLTALLNYTAYPVWHNIFEFSTVIIAVCIFCVIYYSYDQKQNFRYLLLGSMLLLMGFIDFFHAMSFKGMPDFLIPYTTSNRATTFWIIGRLIGGFGLLAASIVPQKVTLRLNKIFFFIVPVVISLIILDLVTYWPNLLPTMYIEGKGLTGTKVLLEYIVIALFLFTIILLLRQYKKSRDSFALALSCALLVGIFSELSFTLYVDVDGLYNYVGHLLKFIMYFVIFRVIFIQNIKLPYTELSNAKDEIKNYADNLNKIVDQRTEQINEIHQKLLEDLEYARGIQMSLLPKELPNERNVAFDARYFSAERLGGDFYNVFKLDDTKIGIYFGDVSGHGVSAAMLTVFLSQSIKAKKSNDQGSEEILPPSVVLTNIYSDYNWTDFNSEVYIAMLYGIFDLSTKEFTFASAGLNVPPYILNSSGDVSALAISGLPICKVVNRTDAGYCDSTVRLKIGDKLFFYTDGLTEARKRR